VRTIGERVRAVASGRAVMTWLRPHHVRFPAPCALSGLLPGAVSLHDSSTKNAGIARRPVALALMVHPRSQLAGLRFHELPYPMWCGWPGHRSPPAALTLDNRHPSSVQSAAIRNITRAMEKSFAHGRVRLPARTRECHQPHPAVEAGRGMAGADAMACMAGHAEDSPLKPDRARDRRPVCCRTVIDFWQKFSRRAGEQ